MSCAKLGTFRTAAVGDEAVGVAVVVKSFDFALIVSDDGTVMVAGIFSSGLPMKFAVDSDDFRLML